MNDQIDFLKIARMKNMPEDSFNGLIKQLVEEVRFVRSKIPATEIQSHLPRLRAFEEKAKRANWRYEPERNYIAEISELLDNEPEPDYTRYHEVFTLEKLDSGKVEMLPTGQDFLQRVLAENWIEEQGDFGTRYVILEVFDRDRLLAVAQDTIDRKQSSDV